MRVYIYIYIYIYIYRERERERERESNSGITSNSDPRANFLLWAPSHVSQH